MKTLLTGRCLAIDVESTGVSVHDDRIVTACAAIVEAGRVVFQRQWLINPGIPIPAEATKVHGVTDEQVQADGVAAEVGVKEFANAVRYAVHSGMAVVAFNAAFDLSMLNAECVRHGLGTLEEFCGRAVARVVDPLCLDKHVDRFRRGSRQLGDTCAHYGVVLEDAHTAAADAIAAARVAYRLAERSQLAPEQVRNVYADPAIRDRYGYRHNPASIAAAFAALGQLTLDRLHAGQVQWYAEQADGLGDYWAKKLHVAGEALTLAAERFEAAEDQSERDQADQERMAAEAEIADLEAKLASLSTEWPVRALPVAVVS